MRVCMTDRYRADRRNGTHVTLEGYRQVKTPY